MRELPRGTVTLLFTDIEGSTRLLHELGDDYADVLAEHRRVLREAFGRHGGVEVDTQGDAFFYAFARAADALAAAAAAQVALSAGRVRVRMGVHSGEPLVTEEGYVGIDVHRAARIMSAGHGGQVLVSDESRSLVGGAAELSDLGLHRLKDLTEPQRLWQLGASRFPPLKTLYQTNLPVQPSPLIGRETELGEVLEFIAQSRLVTLTGAGGSGKTRLALQAAAELTDEFEDGVWWVPLASLSDPALVQQAITAAVGAKEDLLHYLRTRKVLLLLDNFEHLLAAAPRISDLLTEAPDVRILATSRERLALAAEQEYPVPTMAASESVALFTARARRLLPSFEPDNTVAEICRRLDGLPLPIELAASRIKLLRPDQILERLGRSLDLLTGGGRDAPARHQTLRATIEWSYDLLDERRRALFARLAVFAGSFDLGAAEAVCGANMDAVASLVDGNLLRATDERRFFMLETIRAFATEKLAQAPNADELRHRHANYMLDHVGSPKHVRDRRAWRAAIQRDYPDYRAALLWFQQEGENAQLLRLASYLGPFWDGQESLAEGRMWLEEAIERSMAPTVERGRALCRLGHIAWRQGALDVALDSVDAATAIASELGDLEVVADAHATRGATHYDRGDLDAAVREYERSLEVYRSLDAVDDVAVITHDLGLFALMAGDNFRARQRLEESLRLSQESGYAGGEMNTLGSLGFLELQEERLDAAEALLRRALRLAHDLGAIGIPSANDLVGLAAVRARQGHGVEAALLIGASEAHYSRIGAAEETFVQPVRSRTVREIESLIGKTEAASARERGATLSLGDAVEYAVGSDEAAQELPLLESTT